MSDKKDTTEHNKYSDKMPKRRLSRINPILNKPQPTPNKQRNRPTQTRRSKSLHLKHAKPKKEPLSNASKQKHVNNYNYSVETNGLKWERPTYRIAETIPLIPKTDNINKIISASTPKFATIFTILAETGLNSVKRKNSVGQSD